ncbi:MAG: hypothetical protein KUG83_08625 [Gammaproteobacteria bacterium]|nr:hypothetical protein [Gammaproteobacteria bacterium]
MDLSTLLSKFGTKRAIKVLGIELLADSVAAVSVSLSKEHRPVLHQTFNETFTPDTMEAVLTTLLNSSGCEQCSITLAKSYYQLMLIDSPEVPDEELTSAMKWKVSELTNQPAEEIVIDAFRLPGDAYRGRMDMSYAALCQKSDIKKLVDLVDKSNVELTGIGINEIALASMFEWLPAFEGVDLAVVQMEKSGGTLCLLESGKLYLCRTLDGHFSEEEIDEGFLHNTENTDRLGLDIQRSLDYYESQLGKPGIEMGFILVDNEKGLELSDLLNDRLPVALLPFQIHELFETLDVECSVVYGAAVGVALSGLEGHRETSD